MRYVFSYTWIAVWASSSEMGSEWPSLKSILFCFLGPSRALQDSQGPVTGLSLCFDLSKSVDQQESFSFQKLTDLKPLDLAKVFFCWELQHKSSSRECPSSSHSPTQSFCTFFFFGSSHSLKNTLFGEHLITWAIFKPWLNIYTTQGLLKRTLWFFRLWCLEHKFAFVVSVLLTWVDCESAWSWEEQAQLGGFAALWNKKAPVA